MEKLLDADSTTFKELEVHVKSSGPVSPSTGQHSPVNHLGQTGGFFPTSSFIDMNRQTPHIQVHNPMIFSHPYVVPPHHPSSSHYQYPQPVHHLSPPQTNHHAIESSGSKTNFPSAQTLDPRVANRTPPVSHTSHYPSYPSPTSQHHGPSYPSPTSQLSGSSHPFTCQRSDAVQHIQIGYQTTPVSQLNSCVPQNSANSEPYPALNHSSSYASSTFDENPLSNQAHFETSSTCGKDPSNRLPVVDQAVHSSPASYPHTKNCDTMVASIVTTGLSTSEAKSIQPGAVPSPTHYDAVKSSIEPLGIIPEDPLNIFCSAKNHGDTDYFEPKRNTSLKSYSGFSSFPLALLGDSLDQNQSQVYSVFDLSRNHSLSSVSPPLLSRSLSHE